MYGQFYILIIPPIVVREWNLPVLRVCEGDRSCSERLVIDVFVYSSIYTYLMSRCMMGTPSRAASPPVPAAVTVASGSICYLFTQFIDQCKCSNGTRDVEWIILFNGGKKWREDRPKVPTIYKRTYFRILFHILYLATKVVNNSGGLIWLNSVSSYTWHI